MTKYTIACPKCKAEIGVTVKRNETVCEICACGFPEKEGIFEWQVK
jgi:hypothetical protein